VLGFAILFGATRASVAEPASATTDAPNIVVILVDDQRFDTLDRMREVRRLIASHGVTFTNAFVTTSECCPSRASILSGQYSHRTGVLQNFGPAGYPAFNERSNLAVWLRRAGYQTALVGKYLNDYTVYGHHRIPGRARGRWPRSERCHLDRPKGSHS
jgi:arylsulfatase A-like enzyme